MLVLSGPVGQVAAAPRPGRAGGSPAQIPFLTVESCAGIGSRTPYQLARGITVRALRARRNDARSGSAAVELAVVLPVLVTLLVGIWEVGRMVQVKQIMSN